MGEEGGVMGEAERERGGGEDTGEAAAETY